MIDFPNNPILGQVAMSPNGAVWVWNGVSWAYQSSGETSSLSTSGMVGYAQITASQGGGITTPTDIGGLAVTFNATVGHTYRVVGHVYSMGTAAGAASNLSLCDGTASTQYQSSVTSLPIAGTPFKNHLEFVFAPTVAGSQTFKLRVSLQGGTGTLSVEANPVFPGFLSVEDITYEAATFVRSSSGGGSGFTFTQDTQPTAAKQGDTWFNNGTGAGGGRSCVAVNEIPGNVNSELIWVQFAPGSGAAAFTPAFRRMTGSAITITTVATTNLTFTDNAGDSLGSIIGNPTPGVFSLSEKGVYMVDALMTWSTSYGAPGAVMDLYDNGGVSCGSQSSIAPWGMTENCWLLDHTAANVSAGRQYGVRIYNYMATMTCNVVVRVARVSARP